VPDRPPAEHGGEDDQAIHEEVAHVLEYRFTIEGYHRTTARLEVHREPRGDGYGDVRVLVRGERVSPGAFPDLSLGVAELIG
jgi:hypothetical protein